MSGFQSTLVAISVFLCTASLAGEVSLEAERLRLTPEHEQLVATGRVRLTAGRLKIDASLLILDLNRETAKLIEPVIIGYGDALIEADQLTLSLSDNTLALTEPSFELRRDFFDLSASARDAHCKDGTCVLRSLNVSACPHDPVGYEIRAKKMVVHPSGDIDLSSPVLVVDGKPVFALPWIRLRPPNTFGFLPPHMGYSQTGGFIVGPAGFIPLGSHIGLEGHFAVRTASGFEASTMLTSEKIDLRIDHLVEHQKSHARFRSQAHFPLESASLSADVDLLTSKRVIEETTQNPLDRAMSHTVSRVLASSAGETVLVETYFELLEPFDAMHIVDAHPLIPTASVEVGLPASPLVRFFWPEFNLLFVRRGAASADTIVGADGITAPGHSVVDITYGFGVPGRLGPFEIGTGAALRHQAWQGDMAAQGGSAVHTASVSADINLPMARNFQTVRHHVEPYLRYRLIPWRIGSSPDWIIDDSDRLRSGQGIEIGFLTKLSPNKSSPIARLEVWERLDLPGYDMVSGPAYMAATASFGREQLALAIDGAYDHSLQGLSLAGISLTSRFLHLSRMAVGARWIGPGLGPHLDQTFGVAGGPWLVSRWLPFENGQVEIFEDLNLFLTKRLRALFGMRMGIWPEAALHILQYGLEWGASCGCASISLMASHRLSQPVPDVMLGISMPGM